MKRAQIWGTDLLVAIALFTASITLFYVYSIDPIRNVERISSLNNDGEIIAGHLLTEGYPLNWTADSIILIGITNNNAINETKLSYFYNLSVNDYEKTQNLFDTIYDYYVNFSEPMIINGQYVEYIGNKDSNARNLIEVNRVTIYQNKPAVMNVYIWE